MKKYAIIPARYHSSRFQGKVLAKIGGKSMLQRVFEQACKADFDKVFIITDHPEVEGQATAFGAPVYLSEEEHENGTSRIAELAGKMADEEDIVVNLQADEPFINPSDLNRLLEAIENSDYGIASLFKSIIEPDELYSPNTVKITKTTNNKALYFSRAGIPWLRDVKVSQWLQNHEFYKHLGVYAFRHKTLKRIIKLPQSELSKAEKLEQLSWLENGYDIYLCPALSDSLGVDTLSDLRKAEEYLQTHSEFDND